MADELERKDIEKSEIDWNEHAEYWDDFDDARKYTKNIYQLLTEIIDLNNLKIVDFGCGTGLLTELIAKEASEIVAVDSSPKMIEVLNNKKLENVNTINSELSEETIKNNPELQQQFDLIVASSVCAFLPNYEEILSLIKSMLKPGGTFVQWDWLRSDKDPNFGFTKDMIAESYKKVGLVVQSIKIPFYMMENDEKMEVLMAVSKV